MGPGEEPGKTQESRGARREAHSLAALDGVCIRHAVLQSPHDCVSIFMYTFLHKVKTPALSRNEE